MGEDCMTPGERVFRAVRGRAHMRMLMDLFEAYEDWENYFHVCNLYHMYDEFLKAKGM